MLKIIYIYIRKVDEDAHIYVATKSLSSPMENGNTKLCHTTKQ
jgi:hypothetical protein